MAKANLKEHQKVLSALSITSSRAFFVSHGANISRLFSLSMPLICCCSSLLLKHRRFRVATRTFHLELLCYAHIESHTRGLQGNLPSVVSSQVWLGLKTYFLDSDFGPTLFQWQNVTLRPLSNPHEWFQKGALRQVWVDAIESLTTRSDWLLYHHLRHLRWLLQNDELRKRFCPSRILQLPWHSGFLYQHAFHKFPGPPGQVGQVGKGEWFVFVWRKVLAKLRLCSCIVQQVCAFVRLTAQCSSRGARTQLW